MSAHRPRRLRASRACDYCHNRRIKCLPSRPESGRCQNCVDFELVCKYDRPLRRGRAPAENHGASRPHPAAGSLPESGDDESRAFRSHRNGCIDYPSPEESARESAMPVGGALSRASGAFARASTSFVKSILAVYFETVYPIFPLFDRETIESRVASGEHARSRPFFCAVMAACALASARVRDGALVTPERPPPDLLGVPPEDFFCAAEDALPADVADARDLGYLQGCALLALAGIQDGRIDRMRKYVGQYFTIMAVSQWHDESNWPTGLSMVEKEERRRLYWSIYTLDIYTSIVWDGCPHFSEAHARVEYPRGIDTSAAPDTDWIVGWNFTTDLYRILEHAVTRLRTRHSRFNLFDHSSDTPRTAEENASILRHVDTLFIALPPAFRELRPATGRAETDIYGFQAANIQATLALLRMVLFSLEEDADLEKRCAVASDVLDTFHLVPREFQRAISTPLIYHIASIGKILGSVMGGPLSERSYMRVRSVLVSMASLLESLEAFLRRRADAGTSLTELVSRIDAYMAERRQAGRVDATVEPVEGMQVGRDVISEFSPLFHLPEELLQEWNWPSMLLSDSQDTFI